MRDVHGTTCRGKDHEGCSARRLPEDKKGEHQRYIPPCLKRSLNYSAPAILQGSRSLEYPIPSECLETFWCSGGHGERTIRHCVRVDGAWKHHAVH